MKLAAAMIVTTFPLALACGSSEDGSGSAAGGAGSGGSASGGTASGGTASGGAGSGGTPSGGNGGTSGAGGSAGSASGGAAGGGGTAGSGGTGQGGSGGSGATSLRFIAVGDCGKGNTEQYTVGSAIAQKCATSGCDFVQLLGDNIYDSGVSGVDDPQWQDKFEKPYQNVNAPFWVVLGNHDYGGNGAGYEVWKADYQVQYSQKSSKWKLPAKYYLHSESQAAVDFVGLDTNAAMFGFHAQQKSAVTQWAQSSGATWKIAFGHHPYLSNGPHGNAGTYEGIPGIPVVSGAGVKDLMDNSVCGKFDVYISGHDHSKQWLTPTCSGTELIVSGGGASTTELKGQNSSYFQASKTGFLYVEITGKTFKGEFYDSSGNLEFSRTLTK